MQWHRRADLEEDAHRVDGVAPRHADGVVAHAAHEEDGLAGIVREDLHDGTRNLGVVHGRLGGARHAERTGTERIFAAWDFHEEAELAKQRHIAIRRAFWRADGAGQRFHRSRRTRGVEPGEQAQDLARALGSGRAFWLSHRVLASLDLPYAEE